MLKNKHQESLEILVMKTEVLGRIHAKVLKNINFAPDLPGHQAEKPGRWKLDQIVRHSFNQKEGMRACMLSCFSRV